MRTITIGVDLAKQVFSVCSVDAAGRVQDRRELRRDGRILQIGQRGLEGAELGTRKIADHLLDIVPGQRGVDVDEVPRLGAVLQALSRFRQRFRV